MSSVPSQFEKVTVQTKANVYFDGKVVSHTLVLPSGEKKTLGIIYPGSFHFTTAAPERMDIVSGQSRVRLKGEEAFRAVNAGEGFDVPANSAFDITVESALTEYVCTFK